MKFTPIPDVDQRREISLWLQVLGQILGRIWWKREIKLVPGHIELPSNDNLLLFLFGWFYILSCESIPEQNPALWGQQCKGGEKWIWLDLVKFTAGDSEWPQDGLCVAGVCLMSLQGTQNAFFWGPYSWLSASLLGLPCWMQSLSTGSQKKDTEIRDDVSDNRWGCSEIPFQKI